MSGSLSDAGRHRMAVPPWEQVRTAIEAGEQEEALRLLDRMVDRWRGLQDHSMAGLCSGGPGRIGQEPPA